jgi:hypothetical protein
VAPFLSQWRDVGGDIHFRLNDPQLGKTMANAASLTGSWAEISKDSADKFHAWLYPEKKKRTKLGLAWQGIVLGRDLALPGAELGYYLSNMR